MELGRYITRSGLEEGIDEAFPDAADLALREGPEFNGLAPSDQRIGEKLKTEQPSGPSQEKTTGRRIGVHHRLDRQNEIRDALDLLKGQEARMHNETVGVAPSGVPLVCPVETAFPRPGDVPDEVSDKGRFADLPGSDHGDDPGVR